MGHRSKAEVLKRFADRLSVEPVRQTQLIKVSFEAHDATLAAAVANATAQRISRRTRCPLRE
jgi:uncharacterized protein involved in exopolysaccharide biosynthesis